jgi:predicted lipid-binding transport protein (Tim44 family)
VDRPRRVTPALSATAGSGHDSVTVRAPSAGTTVSTAVEVGVTTAAWAEDGSATSAKRMQKLRATLKGIRHATTGLRTAPAVLCCRSMGSLPLILAQAGGGSSGFGGGGGGGGGSSFGGGGSGSGEGDPLVAVAVFGLFGLFVLTLFILGVRYRRKVRQREAMVRAASAEAAEDDGYFAPDEVQRHAVALFRAAQMAWDARDRAGLAQLVAPDLLVEWNRRLDDFDAKGWHNRVEVLEDPVVRYVGITNREDDAGDRAVVKVEARLRAYVLDSGGNKVMRRGEKDETVTLHEYWTLARRDGAWMVQSIEQQREGDHHLDAAIVASPWSDEQRLDDESLTELAVADGLPEGFTTADLAEVGFDGDARARALDLSVADARFAPDVLEAAARRIQVSAVGVESAPATMTIEVELGGRRYVEDRDTAAVMSGSKDPATAFRERWTLALDGPDDAPWRLVGVA